MKQFDTLEQLQKWIDRERVDRYSPYDIQHIDYIHLIVYYIRVD
jgi:hypothetical protein